MSERRRDIVTEEDALAEVIGREKPKAGEAIMVYVRDDGHINENKNSLSKHRDYLINSLGVNVFSAERPNYHPVNYQGTIVPVTTYDYNNPLERYPLPSDDNLASYRSQYESSIPFNSLRGNRDLSYIPYDTNDYAQRHNNGLQGSTDPNKQRDLVTYAVSSRQLKTLQEAQSFSGNYRLTQQEFDRMQNWDLPETRTAVHRFTNDRTNASEDNKVGRNLVDCSVIDTYNKQNPNNMVTDINAIPKDKLPGIKNLVFHGDAHTTGNERDLNEAVSNRLHEIGYKNVSEKVFTISRADQRDPDTYKSSGLYNDPNNSLYPSNSLYPKYPSYDNTSYPIKSLDKDKVGTINDPRHGPTISTRNMDALNFYRQANSTQGFTQDSQRTPVIPSAEAATTAEEKASLFSRDEKFAKAKLEPENAIAGYLLYKSEQVPHQTAGGGNPFNEKGLTGSTVTNNFLDDAKVDIRIPVTAGKQTADNIRNYISSNYRNSGVYQRVGADSGTNIVEMNKDTASKVAKEAANYFDANPDKAKEWSQTISQHNAPDFQKAVDERYNKIEEIAKGEKEKALGISTTIQQTASATPAQPTQASAPSQTSLPTTPKQSEPVPQQTTSNQAKPATTTQQTASTTPAQPTQASAPSQTSLPTTPKQSEPVPQQTTSNQAKPATTTQQTASTTPAQPTQASAPSQTSLPTTPRQSDPVPQQTTSNQAKPATTTKQTASTTPAQPTQASAPSQTSLPTTPNKPPLYSQRATLSTIGSDGASNPLGDQSVEYKQTDSNQSKPKPPETKKEPSKNVPPSPQKNAQATLETGHNQHEISSQVSERDNQEREKERMENAKGLLSKEVCDANKATQAGQSPNQLYSKSKDLPNKSTESSRMA